MTLLIILAVVFGCVGLMVFFGERHAKPVSEKDMAKYSKIIPFLMGVLLIAVLIKML